MAQLGTETADREAVRLLQGLVGAPSPNPPGDERAAIAVARDYLESIPGIEIEDVGVSPERPMLIATLRGGAGEGRTLLFGGHIDTVPVGDGWTRDPFGGQIEDGRLYGRGASDMKGGIAGFLVAMRQLANLRSRWAGTIVAHVVPDEEPGGQLGAEQLLKSGRITGDAAIIAEPSELAVFSAQKGNLFATIVFKGRSAHGSMPELGDNAISHAIRFAGDVERQLAPELRRRQHPLVGRASVSIGTIHGGVRTNVVPDECVLTIDRRVLPDEDIDEAIADLTRFVGDRGTISFDHVGAAFDTPADHWLVRTAVDVVNEIHGTEVPIGGLVGSSDARFYAAGAGIPTIIIGPGSMSQAHVPDEWVDVELLQRSVTVYRELALRLLESRT